MVLNSEAIGFGGLEGLADGALHFVVPVREVPLVGGLDHAVEGDEEVGLDRAHRGVLRFGGARCTARPGYE
jgi:hypothetical protein